MKELEIIRFRDEEEYKQWLEGQSYAVKMKAKKYNEKFGNIPIVLSLCVDTSMYSLGCEHVVHLFVNPNSFDLVMNNIVADEGE